MQEVLDWFYRTHEAEAVGMGGALYRLKRLPRAGGLAKQDAKLMQALTHCRIVANHLLARRRAADEDAELKKFHEDERRGRPPRERTH